MVVELDIKGKLVLSDHFHIYAEEEKQPEVVGPVKYFEVNHAANQHLDQNSVNDDLLTKAIQMEDSNLGTFEECLQILKSVNGDKEKATRIICERASR